MLVVEPPLWKIWKSMGRITVSHILWKRKNVPNHQPDMICCTERTKGWYLWTPSSCPRICWRLSSGSVSSSSMAFSMVDNFCKTNGLPRATHHSVRSKWLFLDALRLRPPTRDLSNCRNTRLCSLRRCDLEKMDIIRTPKAVTAVIEFWGMQCRPSYHVVFIWLWVYESKPWYPDGTLSWFMDLFSPKTSVIL